MPVTIQPVAEEHIDGFRAALDAVARERRYLLFTEAPSANGVADFVRCNIATGVAQFVAVDEDSGALRRPRWWCGFTAKHMEILLAGPRMFRL